MSHEKLPHGQTLFTENLGIALNCTMGFEGFSYPNNPLAQFDIHSATNSNVDVQHAKTFGKIGNFNDVQSNTKAKLLGNKNPLIQIKHLFHQLVRLKLN